MHWTYPVTRARRVWPAHDKRVLPPFPHSGAPHGTQWQSRNSSTQTCLLFSKPVLQKFKFSGRMPLIPVPFLPPVQILRFICFRKIYMAGHIQSNIRTACFRQQENAEKIRIDIPLVIKTTMYQQASSSPSPF